MEGKYKDKSKVAENYKERSEEIKEKKGKIGPFEGWFVAVTTINRCLILIEI